MGRGIFIFIREWFGSLSGLGFILGTLFFAASLTPTLIPRSYATQGALAGACFAIGYGLGVLWQRLWTYLELPAAQRHVRQRANAIVAALCLLVALVFLARTAGWQNSIRSLMGMEPLTSAHPITVSAIALATFVVLLLLARLFQFLARRVAAFMRRFVPRRIANIVGVSIAILLFWSLSNDLLFRTAFHLLDTSYREYDALIEPETRQPSDPGRTGSAASLVRWDELGRAGREFVATGPTGNDIGALTKRPAREPIRVYVGLRAADTPGARAKIALEELKRQGGFSRSVLIVITPTGTGWVDPAAIDSVEYLHDGDIASVAVQYSYLSSPLSLMTQPEYGSEIARALFHEVYGHWTTLPKDTRPRFYLHGLSLGAFNSEKSAGLLEMIGDPIAGAMWSGPPFESLAWRSISAGRNEGSPQWLPEYRDGRAVRFMNQAGSRVPSNAPWGAMRIVYLQYASDPIVFFDYRDLYRRPAWMEPPRGPDVSPALRWYPVVTMLQLALDMAFATTTPIGHGHVYAPEHYVNAWVAVTDVQDWPPESLSVLKRRLADKANAAAVPDGSTEQPYDNRGG